MPSSDHYFSAAPASAENLRTITVPLAGRERAVTTAGGVFSPDRLDTGTAVLFANMASLPPSGNFLDLGCGWGPISLTMALSAPHATIWAVDVNERALELTARNAEGLDVHAVLAEDVPAGLEFDAIWSNPPIRIGKEALRELLLTWLPRLAPAGRMVMVIGKNLGGDSMQRWLTDQGWPTTRLASSKGFRVLETRRG